MCRQISLNEAILKDTNLFFFDVFLGGVISVFLCISVKRLSQVMKVQKHFIYAAIQFLVDDIVSLQYLHMLDMLAVYVTVINYYKENEVKE